MQPDVRRACTPASITPVVQAPPPPVQHRDRAVARDCDRQAVGGQRDRRQAALNGELSVGTRHLIGARAPGGRSACGRELADVRAVDLAHESQLDVEFVLERSAVTRHCLGIVSGKAPEVEALVRTAREATAASREHRPCPSQVYRELLAESEERFRDRDRRRCPRLHRRPG